MASAVLVLLATFSFPTSSAARGFDDKYINTLDTDGVALAAIQGLYQIVQEKDAQIAVQQQQMAAMQAENAAQRERAAALETRVAALERLVQASAAQAP